MVYVSNYLTITTLRTNPPLSPRDIMLIIPDCLKTPEYSPYPRRYPHGVDFRKHRDWRACKSKVLGIPLAGAGVSKVYVQIEGTPSDVEKFRFVFTKKNWETLTVRDLFIALTAYLFKYLPADEIQNTFGIPVQDQVANAYTNEQVQSFFDSSTLPFWDPEPGPENFLDAISAVDVSHALYEDYRLPPRWRDSGQKDGGDWLYRAILDEKCVFGGLRRSPTREDDTLLLRLLRPREDPKQHIYSIQHHDNHNLMACVQDTDKENNPPRKTVKVILRVKKRT